MALVSCKETGNDSNIETQQQEPAKNVFSQPKTALDSINELLSNDAHNVHLLAIRAKMHLANDNVSAARNDINLALSIDSGVATIREAKGEMAFMLNKSRRAKKEWEACIKIDPKNTGCLLSLTELYIAVQNYDRALKMVNQLLDASKDNAEAYFAKGIIIRDKFQDTTLAIQYFQNAIDLKKNYWDAIDMMAVTLANRQDTLAKFYYQQILEAQPTNYHVWYKLGVFYMRQNEFNRAMEAYSKVIEFNPSHADAYYNMGFMHIDIKQWQVASGYFTKSIQSIDRNYKAHYGRGYCFEMVGDVINARKDYYEAVKILNVYTPAKEALQRLDRLDAQQ